MASLNLIQGYLNLVFPNVVFQNTVAHGPGPMGRAQLGEAWQKFADVLVFEQKACETLQKFVDFLIFEQKSCDTWQNFADLLVLSRNHATLAESCRFFAEVRQAFLVLELNQKGYAYMLLIPFQQDKTQGSDWSSKKHVAIYNVKVFFLQGWGSAPHFHSLFPGCHYRVLCQRWIFHTILEAAVDADGKWEGVGKYYKYSDKQMTFGA